MIQNLFF